MKTFKDLLPLLALLAGVLGFVSCSDDNEDTVDEYADWQVKNENYWKDLYTATKTHGTVQYGEMQYIIVHVLENGTGTDRAAFTDSVKVHYEGHLIPSPTYTAGYRFDASYSGTFSPVTSNPTILKISNLTDGFATAVMKMRAGDHWMVYIPFTLGYGKTKQTGSSIPAYSNLIFDLRMVGVCR